MLINVEDLKEGKIYVALSNNNKDWNSLFNCAKSSTRALISRLYLNGSSFDYNERHNTTTWNKDIIFREATYEEKEWFKDCLDNKKLMPKRNYNMEDLKTC